MFNKSTFRTPSLSNNLPKKFDFLTSSKPWFYLKFYGIWWNWVHENNNSPLEIISPQFAGCQILWHVMTSYLNAPLITWGALASSTLNNDDKNLSKFSWFLWVLYKYAIDLPGGFIFFRLNCIITKCYILAK